MKDTEKEDISILLRYEVTEKEPYGVSRHDRNVYVVDDRLHRLEAPLNPKEVRS